MARRIKTTLQQAKWATKLWQGAEQKLTLLEQQHQDHQPLSLPAPSNDTPPVPPQNLSSRAVDTETQTDDTTHPMVSTVDATTMTDSIQQLVVETSEKSTQVDRAPCPQTGHASTQTVPQTVVTTSETSKETNMTPRLQNRHISTQTPQPTVVTTPERSTQIDRAPPPETMQAATQTDPPSHNSKTSSWPKSLLPS